MQKYTGSILSPGSEFRSTSTLEPLLIHNTNCNKIRTILDEGITYTLNPGTPEDVRQVDLLRMIQRGNQQSTKSPAHVQAITKSYTKEIKHGWLIPMTVDCLKKLKGAGVIPLVVADQFTINEHGNIILKARVTHDLSFNSESDTSVNDMIIDYYSPTASMAT